MTRAAHLRVYSTEAEGSQAPVPGFVKVYAVLSERGADSDLTAEWEGRRLVCPQNLRLRVLESTIAFAGAFGAFGVGLVPEDAARAADRELRAYLNSHPGHRCHILTSAWHVPVRWFCGFDPSEKEVYEGPGGPRLRYRADISRASDRVREARGALEGFDVIRGPAEELARLADWLSPFPEGSMLELDYGDVSDLFEPQDIVLDDSCELVQEAVAALAARDMARAGECYSRVVSRWAAAFSVAFNS